MTPLQRYQSDLDNGIIIADAAQQRAILLLDDLYQRLISGYQRREQGLFSASAVSVRSAGRAGSRRDLFLGRCR